MKIIAKTTGGYLVEATTLELANVMGLAYETEIPRNVRSDDNHHRSVVIQNGTTINVSDMYRHIRALENEKKSLESTARSLRAAAVLIERIPARLTPAETQTDESNEPS